MFSALRYFIDIKKPCPLLSMWRFSNTITTTRKSTVSVDVSPFLVVMLKFADFHIQRKAKNASILLFLYLLKFFSLFFALILIIRYFQIAKIHFLFECQIFILHSHQTFRKPSAEPSLLELCRGKGKSLTFRKPSAELSASRAQKRACSVCAETKKSPRKIRKFGIKNRFLNQSYIKSLLDSVAFAVVGGDGFWKDGVGFCHEGVKFFITGTEMGE